jgi:voltage-gated potassium channel Kch
MLLAMFALLLAQPEKPVVIVGFGPQGQMLANMVASPLARSGNIRPLSYLAFDLDPARLTAARSAGFNIVYGDGSRPDVLHAAGVKQPLALVVCHESPEMATHAVKSLSEAYKAVPLYAVARNFQHAGELRAAGADHVCISGSEAGLNLGSEVLAKLGTSEGDVVLLRRGIHEAMAARSVAAAEQKAKESSQQQQQHGAAESGKQHWAKSMSLSKPSNGTVASSASGSLSRNGSSSSTSSGSVGGFKDTICKKPPVEVFILDGRLSYGTGVGEAVAHDTSAAPTDSIDEMVNMHESHVESSSNDGSSSRSNLLGVAVEEDMCGAWNPDGCDPSAAGDASKSSSMATSSSLPGALSDGKR